MTLLTARKGEIGQSGNSLEAVGWAWHHGGSDTRRRSTGGAPRKVLPLPRSGSRVPRLARGLFALAGFCAVLFIGGFFLFVSTIERSERHPTEQADGIVALTGGAERIGDAIDLLAAGHGRRLLISGVNERTGIEAITRLNPTQRHWIDCCVDLDYRARNTIGNAIETRRWMRKNHFETIAVVTSNYHMPRTLVELRHVLTEGETMVAHPVIADGFDVDRWWSDPAAARLVGAEYVKFLVAWLRTRLENDPEQSRFAVIVGRGKPVKMVSEPRLRATN